MKKYILRLYIGIILAIILIVGLAIPVYATIPLPTVQTIDQIEVYRDALGEDNSQLWLVRYNCTDNTTTSMSDAYIFVLKETTTNVTVGTVAAYSFYNNGYGNGIVSFEYNATDALTWGGSYTLYFYGNPTLSWAGGVPPLVSSTAITWIDEGSISDTQERLTTRLRYVAGQLEYSWGVDLIETTAKGTTLTTYGEDYFTNSIAELRSICPDLFYQTMQGVEYEHDILITELLSSGSDTTVLVNNTDYCAQTFTPSESFDITGINLPVYRVANPLTLTISLRATVAGLPSGGDLVSGTYDTSTITTTTTGEWIAVAFTSDYTLTTGVVYALVARTSAAGAGNQIQWFADSDNGYTRGQECTYIAAVWAAVPANDLLFEVEARNAITQGLSHRVEDRLVGTQFDFTNWAAGFGLSRIWWSTIFWLAISCVVMVAASFGANSWDCSMVVLIMMVSYGWRGGWVDTILFALIVAILCASLIYAVFWRKAS